MGRAKARPPMSTASNRPFWRRLFGDSSAPSLPGVLSASEFERLFLREKALADRSLRSFALVVLDPDEPTPEVLVASAKRSTSACAAAMPSDGSTRPASRPCSRRPTRRAPGASRTTS